MRYIVFFLMFLGTALQAALPVWQKGSRNEVFYLRQSGEFKSISDSELNFFRKTVERANAQRAKAIVLELDTPGGEIETAFKYVSVMEKSAVPIVVYLKPNGISAGAIMALGADCIAISPNGLIGDAMPMQSNGISYKPITERPAEPTQIPQKSKDNVESVMEELKKLDPSSGGTAEEQRLSNQKFLSVYFKMLQVLAEKNQRPAKIIRAMADPYTRLDAATDGIEHSNASPLTLSAAEAHKLKVVDLVVRDRLDLLSQLDLSEAKIVEVERSAWEEIGNFLAHPVVTALLLIFGLVGIFVEIKTPGFGIAGTLGVLLLTLFFLGHMANGSSSWGPLVIFFVGLVLLAIEIFAVPGFGLVGISGILCIMVSFFGAFGWENINYAAQIVSLSLIIAIVAMVLLAVYVLPKSQLFRSTALATEVSSADGYTAQTADRSLIGANGIALTDLRPSGTVEIDGKRHDAASEGGYLEAGCAVEVTACNNFQLIVRRKNC